MIFKIDLQSGQPVYAQLMEQAKHAIASGRLRAGDRLPSLRELAVELRVNRNTVARAYADLEAEGVIVNRQGQGAFVAEGSSPLAESFQRRQLEGAIDAWLVQARLYGYDGPAIEALVHERLKALDNPEQRRAAETTRPPKGNTG